MPALSSTTFLNKIKNSFNSIFSRQAPLYESGINHPAMLEKINGILKYSSLGLFYFDIANFQDFDEIHGNAMAERTIKILQTIIERSAQNFLPQVEVVLTKHLWADDFILFFVPQEIPSGEELYKMAAALRLGLKEQLHRSIPVAIANPLEIHVGFAMIDEVRANTSYHLYKALKEAQKTAKGILDLRSAQLMDEFTGIVQNKLLSIVYQPIVSFETGGIMGWEALTRGPAGSYFHSPGMLFPFAEEVHMLYPLEKVARENALGNIGNLDPGQHLFININPQTINDPNFVKGETKNLLHLNNLSSSNIVFEITERHTIQDFTSFNRSLEHYRYQGYKIAVDDAGAGYSSLQTIAEIHPDFIKMDMSMVQGINKSPVKKALLETFVTFAQKIGCTIIAEGIETDEEMRTLMGMGVHYGQGFYLARPAFPKPQVNPEVQTGINLQIRNRFQNNLRHTLPIGNITESALQVDKERPVKEVHELLDNNEPVNGVVVMDGSRSVGLLMRHHLHRYLGSPYGVSLYFGRPVSSVMDCSPLIVAGDTPIDTVAQVAMNRERKKLYDYIIVVKDDALQGIVSVQNLLDTMTRIKIELAQGANPLTGLPGNRRIDEEIEERVNLGRPFTVIYGDIDCFKSFNDKYGFDCGDKLILLTARLIGRFVGKYGNGNDFVGHIGGDDFVVLTSPDKAEDICRRVLRAFDLLAPLLYSAEDRKMKMICSKNRNGEETCFPLVSISLALVDCLPGRLTNRVEITEVAAGLKRNAKSLKGSVFVTNR